MWTAKSLQQTDAVYYVIFEDYLQPKSSRKPNFVEGSKELLQPKILHHVSRPPSKYRKQWRTLMGKLKGSQVSVPPRTHHFKPAVQKVMQRLEAKPQAIQSDAPPKTWCDHLACLNLRRELPQFLAFLRARNDEHLCKRKTGFEIYCEMASVHGFINFVGARTWQRIFWCLVVSVAIVMSMTIVLMSFVMNADTPTILYTESTTHPAWTIPFPAVTICSMNRLSKRRVAEILQNFSMPAQQIQPYFRYALYLTDQTNARPSDYAHLQRLLDSKNYSATEFLEDIAPDCGDELLRCQWKGRAQPCSKLFRRIATPQGRCCAFNYHADSSLDAASSTAAPEHTHSCYYKMGLTVLLRPDTADYLAAAAKTAGYQVLIHAPRDYPSNGVARHLALARTATRISVTPRSSYPTAYVGGLKLERRRCYLPGERSLRLFAHYSQTNCLTECQSEMMFARCGCVPPQLPRLDRWPGCKMTQARCVLKQRDILETFLTADRGDYKSNHYAENFICSCFPACEFEQYESSLDSAPIDRKFTMSDRSFLAEIGGSTELYISVLNIHSNALSGLFDYFIHQLIAATRGFEQEYSNRKSHPPAYILWRPDGRAFTLGCFRELAIVCTFGGITGLYMGYSFVSAFEMIFFVFVRPACNWLTRKQIRYRIRRRQKKAAAEQAKKERGKQKNKVKQQNKVKTIDEETAKTIEQDKDTIQVRVGDEKNTTIEQLKDKTAAVQVLVQSALKAITAGREDTEVKPDQLEQNDCASVKVKIFEQSNLSVTDDSNTISHELEEIMPTSNNSEIFKADKRVILFDSVGTPVVDKLVEEMVLLIAKEIANELPDAPG